MFSVSLQNYVDFILSHQCSFGGFSYVKNNEGFVEPTCIALLALHSFDNSISHIFKAIEWLKSMQNLDGGWKMFQGDDDSSPVATALVIITLQYINSDKYSSQIQKGIDYLSNVEDYWKNEELDENIWGWDNGTFIATEPTAFVVLAFKMTGNLNNKRLIEAKQFFLQNKCMCQGWTYGYPMDSNDPKSTSVVYVPLNHQYHITALVLLALQKENIDLSDHIKLLELDYTKSFCPMSISLGCLALQSYGKETLDLVNRLNKIMLEDNYVKNMVIHNAYAILGNLTLKGINPLWIKK